MLAGEIIKRLLNGADKLKLEDYDRKETSIKVRLTQDEKDIIIAFARKNKMNNSEFIRYLVFDLYASGFFKE